MIAYMKMKIESRTPNEAIFVMDALIVARKKLKRCQIFDSLKTRSSLKLLNTYIAVPSSSSDE